MMCAWSEVLGPDLLLKVLDSGSSTVHKGPGMRTHLHTLLRELCGLAQPMHTATEILGVACSRKRIDKAKPSPPYTPRGPRKGGAKMHLWG